MRVKIKRTSVSILPLFRAHYVKMANFDLGENCKKRVLVGATGSVAAIKIPELVEQLQMIKEPQLEVEVVATNRATHFFDAAGLSCKCHLDEHEWVWSTKGDPILHIELRRWADLLVIAPLDANTMAKMANGLCDNLLTCVVRAWDAEKPLLFCPAMNTAMWTHQLTQRHREDLFSLGYVEVPPVTKKLACGDEGMGAMATVLDIVQAVLKHIH